MFLVFFFNKQKILNRDVGFCDFKQFVKNTWHLTHIWTGISPQFWLRAQTTLLNRIFPGQASSEFPHLFLLSVPDPLPSEPPRQPSPHQHSHTPAIDVLLPWVQWGKGSTAPLTRDCVFHISLSHQALPGFTSEKLDQIKVQLFCTELQPSSAVSLINS